MSLVLCAALILMLGGGDLTSVSEDDYDFSMPFEYRLVYKNLGDIPIGPDDFLEQRSYIEQRLIFASNLYCGDVNVTTEFDAGGILDGDSTNPMVNSSRIARNHKYGWAVDRLFVRETYLLYSHKYYRIYLGQKLFHWGMGMLFNNGRERQLFGENYFGDTGVGLKFSYFPMKLFMDSDLSDRIEMSHQMTYVIRDNFANNYYGDIAYQLASSMTYDSESGMDLRDGFKVGLLYIYRDQTNRYDERMRLNIFDLFLKKEHFINNDISMPNIFLFFEFAYLIGNTEKKLYGRERDYSIDSYGFILRSGITDKDYNIYIDLGYALGDDNPYDGKMSQFIFNPEFREGIILFSELYGFSSALSSVRSNKLLLSDPRPEYLESSETMGGISNATFISLNTSYKFAALLRLDYSIILANTDKGIIDPYFTYKVGENRNYYDSVTNSKFLGVENDIGLESEWYRNRYFKIKTRCEYGILFVGDALHNPDNKSDVISLFLMKISIDNL